MTQCLEQLDFGFLCHKSITADFDGGELSSDGGVMLVREADHRLGLTAALAACAQAWKMAGLDAAKLDLDRVGIYLAGGEGELDFAAFTGAALAAWNPQTNAVPLNIKINGVAALASQGSALILAGNPDDSNSMTQPKKIVPLAATMRGVKPIFTYKLPPSSIVVLKLKAHP